MSLCLPPLATLAALLLGLVSAAMLAHPAPRLLLPLLAGQLLCALVAPWLARRLDASADAHAALAWVADCTVAYALAWALPWPLHTRLALALACVVVQVASPLRWGPVSGRAGLALCAHAAVVEALRGRL